MMHLAAVCLWGLALGQASPDEVPDAGVEWVLEDAGLPVEEDAGVVLLPVEVPDAGRETTVTGRKMVDVRRVAGSAQVIGKEELERQEANDLHRVLQGVPGVYVREEDGFGLRPNIGIRGASADRSSKVTLMEDGVLSGPAPYSAAAAYYTPLMTRMVGVEIYKGPASIRFGPQTIGGAMNLRTREAPRAFEGDLDISLGNYGSAKGHGVIGYGTERFGVLLEGVHLRSDGFKQLDGGGNTGFDKNELMLKARAATDRHEFQLKLGLSTERSNESYLGLSNDDFARTPQRRYAASANDQMNWWRTQMELTHTFTLSEQFEISTTAYRHDFQRVWNRLDHFRQGPALYELLAYPSGGTGAVYRGILSGAEDTTSRDQQLMVVNNGRTFVSQGLQTLARLTLMSGPISHELELGLRFHHDEIRRRHTQSGFDMLRGTLVPNGEEAELIADNLASTRSFSANLSDTISWGHFLLAPGARVEVYDATLSDRLSGAAGNALQVVPLLGIGAVYTFDFGLSVLAGVNQGFSPPPPGQVDALPERALNSELGFRYGRRGIRLEAIGFWSEYSNITGECTGSSGCTNDALNQQFNGGAARLLGAEVLGSVKGKLGWGTTGAVELAYTFTSAQFLSDFQSANPSWGNVVAGAALPYVPAHQGQLRVRASKGPVELGVGAVYYGQSRELAGVGEPNASVVIPGRVLLDATASVEFGAARFYLTATNLTNQSALVARRPFGARPQAPLLFQAGFKYAFR
ncbi:MAG: TonB-dependent receptor [Archangium sp.]|nr:TonB-dependent receptor [Archangium sp.]MDP3572316.1 TonB-dependent receptor [Archangium sp.]